MRKLARMYLELSLLEAVRSEVCIRDALVDDVEGDDEHRVLDSFSRLRVRHREIANYPIMPRHGSPRALIQGLARASRGSAKFHDPLFHALRKDLRRASARG